MQTMYDVSAFLERFGNNPKLATTLIELLDVWQQIDEDEHGFPDQTLQQRANQLIGAICSEFGLTKADLQTINDHEEAFRSHLRHPSRPR